NRDLVAKPPRTWQELIELDRDLRARGKRAIAWDYAYLYFSWPVIAGSGGYSLRKRDGLYDLDDLGIANAGAVAGFEQIRRLLELGVLTPEDNYERMMKAFKAGELAMMINGPWVWNELREAGMRFGIDHVPGIDADRPGKPFVGILAAATNAHSPNQAQAQRFLDDYLTTADGLCHRRRQAAGRGGQPAVAGNAAARPPDRPHLPLGRQRRDHARRPRDEAFLEPVRQPPAPDASR